MDPESTPPGVQPPSQRLLTDALRLPVEQIAAQHFGREWRVKSFRGLDDFASHPCAILADGAEAVFVKLTQAANGLDQFEVEIAGLRYLAEHAGVRVPAPIGAIALEGGALMVLEAAQEVERTPQRWREIGQALARIHRVQGDRYGFEKQGYFGPLYQDNRPMPDWLSFFTERRLWPRLMEAIDSGNLPTETIRQVEKLIARLPNMDIPASEPCLLHGDAQNNNFISTAQGAMVIDPAVYYGNPEMDLAYVDYFAPAPEELFEGYREELPIQPGFAERKDLWRIPAHLAVVAVAGQSYLPQLNNALRRYV